MDKYYGNVCELDIIFNFQKAYFILDELLLAGEMQESSKKNVLRCISQQDSLEDMEVRFTMWQSTDRLFVAWPVKIIHYLVHYVFWRLTVSGPRLRMKGLLKSCDGSTILELCIYSSLSTLLEGGTTITPYNANAILLDCRQIC